MRELVEVHLCEDEHGRTLEVHEYVRVVNFTGLRRNRASFGARELSLANGDPVNWVHGEAGSFEIARSGKIVRKIER